MDIAAWLQGLGLERYEQAFLDSAIDAEILPKLTAEDLKDIGVTVVGHRRKLLEAIAALENGRTDQAGATIGLAQPVRGAERRQLTVLFCDLVGSTELSTRLDPEEMRDVIGAYQACVAGIVGRWEGHVAKYVGDGVLASFGWPEAHEDDAERAVRAGLGIVDAVAGLWPAEVRLQCRVGISTGLVVVADLIGAGHELLGEAPNRAARLQALAEPDSVLIGDRTRAMLRDLFEYAELGERRIKGFAEPVRVSRVLRPGAVRGRFDALHGTAHTPGRARA